VKRYRSHIFVVIALAVILSGGWHAWLRQDLSDLRFAWQSRPASGNVVVIGIDAASIEKIGVWPWAVAVTRTVPKSPQRACHRLSPWMVTSELTTAAVEFALFNGIDTFTCIADGGWYSQILALGWMCEPLGLPRIVGGTMTGALRISITRETPRLLLEAGTYSHSTLELATPASMAA